MPKIIPSFEHTLKKKIEALEAEVVQLRLENERQKKEITRLGLQALGKHPHKTALSSKELIVETPSSNLPSYLQPTVASTNRAVKPAVVEDSKTVDDRSSMYVDGRLVVINKPRPHYQLSTLAKGSSDGLWGDESTFGQEKQTLWVAYPRPSTPTTQKNQMLYSCGSCNKLEAAWEDDSAHSLAARSRLDDAEHKFQLSPAACVNLPYRTQHRLLYAAFTLAQDIIWHHLRKHCPNRQIYHCFEGPRQVKFCRNELLGLIADVEWSVKPHFMTTLLTGAMEGVTTLRNTLAHQNRVSLSRVDELITRVQKLAVICLDEQRAMKLRRLRDDLRVQAESVVEDINEKFHGTWGPFKPNGRQWALHHQQTFHDLIGAYKERKFGRYNPAPEVVKMAAREWHSETRGYVLGSLNHEYVVALEMASACLVENGRMTPSDTGRTDEEFEESEKTALERLSTEDAVIKAADFSDEGVGEALKSPGTSD